MKPISILLVDENPIFLDIISHFLVDDFSNKLVLVGKANTHAEAESLAQRLYPEVILVDHGLPGQKGLACVAALRRLVPCRAAGSVWRSSPPWSAISAGPCLHARPREVAPRSASRFPPDERKPHLPGRGLSFVRMFRCLVAVALVLAATWTPASAMAADPPIVIRTEVTWTVEDRFELVRRRRPREAADDLREALAFPLPRPEQPIRVLGEADRLERHESVYTHRHR